VTTIDQSAYALGRIEDEWMADIYNGMDVMCLPTRGEGFGLPLVEAQACGTPVVTTATTSGPELCKSGILIPVTDDDKQWLPSGAWRHRVRPLAIDAALGTAFNFWQWPNKQTREEVRAKVMDYSRDSVWPKYFEPIMAEMERRLKERKQQ
jgi:glycosyltransferase involved in cell wall biosynthesis